MAPDCNSQRLLFTGKSFMKILKIPKYKKANSLRSRSGRCAQQGAVGVSTVKFQPVTTDDVH